MEVYRLYTLGPDGKIIGAKILEFPNDAEAAQHVAQKADGAALELWRGARLVFRITQNANQHSQSANQRSQSDSERG